MTNMNTTPIALGQAGRGTWPGPIKGYCPIGHNLDASELRSIARDARPNDDLTQSVTPFGNFLVHSRASRGRFSAWFWNAADATIDGTTGRPMSSPDLVIRGANHAHYENVSVDAREEYLESPLGTGLCNYLMLSRLRRG